MLDLALLLEGDQGTDRVLERHSRVRPVELVERDLFKLQPAQATLTGLEEVLRPTIGRPLSGTGALEAALGCDHQIVWVRVERLGMSSSLMWGRTSRRCR